MKALSIQQPWAWAIMCAGKNIENRTWDTRFRGRFLVHAGMRFDKVGYFWLMTHRSILQAGLPDIDSFPRGRIIGSVEIDGVCTASLSPWFQGPFGFELRDPKRFSPIPYKGKLGFFNVPEIEIKD
jgi:hypothetical protein